MTNTETMFILRELAQAFRDSFRRRIERGLRPMPWTRETIRRQQERAVSA